MTSWFVKVSDGDVHGPFRENQIRRGLATGRIADTMQLRQGDSPWTDAIQVKLLFKQLAEEGFYLKNEANEVYGPFTRDRVLELHAAGHLPAVYWVRHRSSGPWTRVRSSRVKSAALGEQRRDDRAVTAQVPAAPVMKLRNRSWIGEFFSMR